MSASNEAPDSTVDDQQQQHPLQKQQSSPASSPSSPRSNSTLSNLLTSPIMQLFILALAAMAIYAYADVTDSANAATAGVEVLPHVHHDIHEHAVDFRKPCDCPPAECHPFLNAKSLCECKAAALLACYKKSNGGCPEPAPVVC